MYKEHSIFHDRQQPTAWHTHTTFIKCTFTLHDITSKTQETHSIVIHEIHNQWHDGLFMKCPLIQNLHNFLCVGRSTPKRPLNMFQITWSIQISNPLILIHILCITLTCLSMGHLQSLSRRVYTQKYSINMNISQITRLCLLLHSICKSHNFIL